VADRKTKYYWNGISRYGTSQWCTVIDGDVFTVEGSDGDTRAYTFDDEGSTELVFYTKDGATKVAKTALTLMLWVEKYADNRAHFLAFEEAS